jgi:hypothetical protein
VRLPNLFTLAAAACTAAVYTIAERATRPEPELPHIVPHNPDPDAPETCWRNIESPFGTRVCGKQTTAVGLCSRHLQEMREWSGHEWG